MVYSNDQTVLRNWLCERIGLMPTENIQCIGSVAGDRILGVVGFDNFNGASIMMHVAGRPGWLTRSLLWTCFDYPFNVCKVNMIIGMVPSANKEAIRFNAHLGFKTRMILEGAHPDGALWLMTMERGECRYLNRKRYGQEVKAAATPKLHPVGSAAG